MNEPLGFFIDIAAAIAVMFICPLICCMGMADRLEDRYLQERVSEFNKSICSSGQLEAEKYEAFLRSIGISGKRHDVDIVCETTVWEPIYENGVFSGEAISYVRKIPTEEILNTVYEKGDYCFRYGDSVLVLLTDKEGGFAMSEGVISGIRGAGQ